MRYLILFSFLVLFNTAFSQSKWSYGIMASPNYTYTRPHNHIANYKVTPQVSYELGLHIYRKITKNIYFQTGLELANLRYKEEYYNNAWIPNPPIVEGYFTTYEKVNNVNLLIPLYLNFRVLLTEKFSITSLIGASFGWNLVNKRSVKSIHFNSLNDSDNPKGIDVKNFNFGIGGLYKINDNLCMMIAPHVLTTAKEVGINPAYISVSCRTSLIYNFQ